jgi:hypothetical protein
LDVLNGDGKPRGQALDDDDEALPMRFTGGQITQHRSQGYWRLQISQVSFVTPWA